MRVKPPCIWRAGCGYVGLVKEMMKYYDVGAASIKARNGCDAFHVASKEGHLGKSISMFRIFVNPNLYLFL